MIIGQQVCGGGNKRLSWKHGQTIVFFVNKMEMEIKLKEKIKSNKSNILVALKARILTSIIVLLGRQDVPMWDEKEVVMETSEKIRVRN